MATAVAVLPDDALAGVFRGLPPRSLAVVRCVCKAWRDIVDSHELLLPRLLPHSVRGIFLNYVDHNRPHHMARPCPSSTIPKVDGMLSFLPNDSGDWWSVMDHCNGLLLCDIEWGSELCVCNPATSRWTVLPRPRHYAGDVRYHNYAGAYIAFDPAESPLFHVVLVPNVPKAPPSPKNRHKKKKPRATLWELEGGASFCLDSFFAMADGSKAIAEEDYHEEELFSLAEDSGAAIGEEKAEAYHEEEFQQLPSSVDEDLERDIDPWRLMEWPPTPRTLHVFSSRAGHWEERAFVRQGMPAGTVEKMRLDPEKPTSYGPRRRYSIYHHGYLYVHCRGSFITRFSLSNSEYQIIEAPANVKDAKPYLGKLHKDVCFGIVHGDHRKLKIWTLNKSCEQIEWILKYEVEVGLYAHYVASLPYDNGRQSAAGSWTVEEDNNDIYNLFRNIDIQKSYEWDSDNEDIQNLFNDTDIQKSYEWGSDNDDIHNDDIQNLLKNTDIQKSYEWDSDNDDTFTINHLEGQEYYYEDFYIIGFHPFKEVVFMAQHFRVVAYHLNASKIQYLGNSHPRCYDFYHGIYESFIYTPCMIGGLLYADEAGKSSSDED